MSQAERQEKGPGCVLGMYSPKHQHTKAALQLEPPLTEYLVTNLIVCVSVPSGETFSVVPSLSTNSTSVGRGIKLQHEEAPPLLSGGQSGKNGWLEPAQAVTTRQLSALPYTTSPAYFLLLLNSCHFAFCLWLRLWGGI